MRELKFRQWAGDKFVYWGFTEPGRFSTPTTLNGVALETPHEQFTGLKDKNGVEIYEGDIIYHHYFKEKGHIVWDNTARFLLKYKDELSDTLLPIDMEHFEVIGNIYENPELLL